jgi:hypothetical protein
LPLLSFFVFYQLGNLVLRRLTKRAELQSSLAILAATSGVHGKICGPESRSIAQHDQPGTRPSQPAAFANTASPIVSNSGGNGRCGCA